MVQRDLHAAVNLRYATHATHAGSHNSTHPPQRQLWNRVSCTATACGHLSRGCGSRQGHQQHKHVHRNQTTRRSYGDTTVVKRHPHWSPALLQGALRLGSTHTIMSTPKCVSNNKWGICSAASTHTSPIDTPTTPTSCSLSQQHPALTLTIAHAWALTTRGGRRVSSSAPLPAAKM